jgi:translation elongation factor EF-Tu-like GTPase
VTDSAAFLFRCTETPTPPATHFDPVQRMQRMQRMQRNGLHVYESFSQTPGALSTREPVKRATQTVLCSARLNPSDPIVNTHINAVVRMTSIEEGGRPGGAFSAGYCPHLRVEQRQEWLPVRVSEILVSTTSGWVSPGEEAVIRFELMYPDNPIWRVLVSGEHFEVLEGKRTIGEGRVLP